LKLLARTKDHTDHLNPTNEQDPSANFDLCVVNAYDSDILYTFRKYNRHSNPPVIKAKSGDRKYK